MPPAQPSRVPAGVPTRGRFAAARHTDPGTNLLERTDSAAERELFDRFNASARHWGNRLGVDADDLLQDTAVEFYATLARRRGAGDPQPGLNGRTVRAAPNIAPTMTNPGGWIHRIAYNIAARRVAGTNSSADLAALREYRNRLQDAENRSGRALSPAEADRLADQIRSARPPRRRPTPGFHRRVRTVSTEAFGPDWDTPDPADPLSGTEFAAHTAGAVAENMLSRNGPAGRTAARGLAWDAVANVTGAPVVVPDVIDPVASRAALRHVEDAGCGRRGPPLGARPPRTRRGGAVHPVRPARHRGAADRDPHHPPVRPVRRPAVDRGPAIATYRPNRRTG